MSELELGLQGKDFGAGCGGGGTPGEGNVQEWARSYLAGSGPYGSFGEKTE